MNLQDLLNNSTTVQIDRRYLKDVKSFEWTLHIEPTHPDLLGCKITLTKDPREIPGLNINWYNDQEPTITEVMD